MNSKKYFIMITTLMTFLVGLNTNLLGQEQKDPNDKNKELKQITKAQQQEIDRLAAALADAKKEIERLQAEVAELKEKNAKLQEQVGESVSSVLFTGEETPLTMVEAYTQKYIGKTFIAIGLIRVFDYYNYRYDGAKGTHVSLSFDELRQDMTHTNKDMSLYVRREISTNLVEKLTEAVSTGYKDKLVRVKVSILKNRYDPDCSGIMAELIDWQFLSSDKKSWQDWAISKGTAKPNVETLYNLPNGEIIYHGKKRSKLWFDKMYEVFSQNLICVEGKYFDKKLLYGTAAYLFEPLTKEQFAEAINNGIDIGEYEVVLKDYETLRTLSEDIYNFLENKEDGSVIIKKGDRNVKKLRKGEYRFEIVPKSNSK